MTWHIAARTGELQEGEVVGTQVAGQPVALYCIGGEFFATQNICTHAHACMSDGYLEDGVIECPLHQARFDVRTGAVISGPTRVPLLSYPVKREADQLLVDLPTIEAVAAK